MKRSTLLLMLAVALLLVSGYGLSRAQASSVSTDTTASASASLSDEQARDIALTYIRANKAQWNLTEGDIAELQVARQYASKAGGVTHVYFRQHLGGIEVYNGVINVHILPNGKVFHAGNRAVANLRAAVNTATPRLSATEAVARGAESLGLQLTEELSFRQSLTGDNQTGLLSTGGISQDAIPVRLVYQPLEDGSVRLAWNMTINQVDGEHWWDARVDAITGELLNKFDYVNHDHWGVGASEGSARASHAEVTAPVVAAPAAPTAPFTPDAYRVYPLPVESPIHTTPAPPADGRVLVTDPANLVASPFGWHDTNGAAGAEFTITRGNNAHAYQDSDNDNLPEGDEPDGGPTLVFDFPIDLTQAPNTYTAAAVVNLFYWNNLAHDLNYHYGFDEASGNFQANNYGRGGLGNDFVEAQAQDGGGINNANFATPADGSSPRMQMYLWNLTTPNRDGDFDNGIILHEYGHGISNRLTGTGPGCLGNAEQMGEGWSDWQTIVFTALASHTSTTNRGVGTYALGQPTTGQGIRAFPYNTDMGVDPRTYNTTRTAAVPHGVGSTWTAMLWEMYWNLVGQYGFDPNLYTGTGGNNMAIMLVNEGMKLQPCGPGFVDGRDAILAADIAINGGANQCLIWQAFAKRGLGFSAVQGSANSNADNTEAFDLPSICLAPDFRLTSAPNSLQICSPATATSTVNVISYVGYNDDVTLSATGTPAGYTASFNPVTVTAPNTSTLTLTNSGAATPGTYPIAIQGVGPTSTHSTTLTVDLYTAPASAIGLVSPANGATDVPLPGVTFSWNADVQADTYELEVDDNSDFSSPEVQLTGLTGTSTTVTNLEYGTVFYWRVRGMNGCGAGAWATAFSFTTEFLPGSCTGGTVTNQVFATDFEAGAAGFTLGAGSIGNTWVLSGARTSSGAQAWHATDPATLSDQRLVSPAITLPDATESPITMRFDNYQAFEVPNTDGRCWDASILEITTNGGTTWTQIPNAELLSDPYDAIIWNDTPGNNPLGPVQAWCPNPPPQDWLTSVVDLDAYAGQTVQFRFRHGSDSAVGGEGWYIDDVEVQSCQAPTAVTLGDLGSGSSAPVLPVAAFALLGLVGAAMVWRHRRTAR